MEILWINLKVRTNTELINPVFLRMSPKSGFHRTSNGHKENTQYKQRKDKSNVFMHMFQLSRFEPEASVLKGQITSSRFFLKSLVLRYLDFSVRYLQIFQVDHTFCKPELKILAICNKIRCVRCSWPPSSWAVDLC